MRGIEKIYLIIVLIMLTSLNWLTQMTLQRTVPAMRPLAGDLLGYFPLSFVIAWGVIVVCVIFAFKLKETLLRVFLILILIGNIFYLKWFKVLWDTMMGV